MSSPDAILIPDAHRDIIEVASPDAPRFLHNYCTCDVKNLADKDVSEAFFPTDKGRILTYGLIERLDQTFYISGSNGTAETLIPHLSKYAFLDGVTVKNVTSEWATFLVAGDDAEKICKTVLEGSAARYFHTLESNHPCVRVVCAAVDTEAIQHGLLSTGIRQATAAERESVRIAAGVPIVGTDVSDQNLVQEAARTRIAVSFTKGCYLGQEPIARLDAMGHTNKELRTIEFSETTAVNPGDEVVHGDKSVGTVTSIATAFEKTVALAVLRKAACNGGAEVSVGATTGHVSHAEDAFVSAGRLS